MGLGKLYWANALTSAVAMAWQTMVAPASISILMPSPVLPGGAGGVDDIHAVEVALHL